MIRGNHVRRDTDPKDGVEKKKKKNPVKGIMRITPRSFTEGKDGRKHP